MMFPKVLILTLFIFGTFAKGSIKHVEERFEIMEERFEKLERQLAIVTKAVETEDVETNRGWASTLTNLVSFTKYWYLIVYLGSLKMSIISCRKVLYQTLQVL